MTNELEVAVASVPSEVGTAADSPVVVEPASPSTDSSHTSETSSPEPAPLQLAVAADLSVTFDHTLLPTELWLEIFRYATYVPRSRDLTVVDPFAPERLPNFAWGVNNPVLSLRTKCTLVRVCKAWRAIGTELLYEHVVVASVHRAKLIIRTLQSSSAAAKAAAVSAADMSSTNVDMSRPRVPAQGHGQWIRHLEVRSCTRNTSKYPFLKLVAIVLTYCTSLRVFNGVWTIPVPKEFLTIILHCHGKTLRGLGWEQTDKAFKSSVKSLERGDAPQDAIPDAILSPNYLSRFQQLCVLDLRTLPRSAIMPYYHTEFNVDLNEEPDVAIPLSPSQYPTKFPVPAPVMSLPRVTTLRLPSTPALLNYATRMSLPSLRDLLLDASNVTPYHMASPTLPASHHVTTLTTALLLFLTVHGPSLTSLELVPPVTNCYKPSPYPLSPGFFLQPGVCPNLIRLIYDCRERAVVFPVSLSAVRGLGKKKAGNDSKDTSPTRSATASYEPKDLTYLLTTSCTDLLAHPHKTLRLLAIRGLGISRLYPNRPTHTQTHLLAILAARMAGNLPALETVRTAGFLVDTSTDGLARDIFIWWTERFEHTGVDLVDGEGVIWMYEDEKDEVGNEKGTEVGLEEANGGKEKEGEQGDAKSGTDKQLKDGSESLVDGHRHVDDGEGREKKEDTQDEHLSNVLADGTPKEVVFLAEEPPSYLHKSDSLERSVKDAGREVSEGA